MSYTKQDGQGAGQAGAVNQRGWPFTKTRYALGGLFAGMLLAGWAAGGTDRYGEAEGFFGAVHGTYRTFAKGIRYASASVRDCGSRAPSSVRNLGLGQQIETRLSQDKRVEAQGIIVHVEEDGTAVLSGLVTDAAHKEKAVALTRDTRGVERIVDELAVSPRPRIIETKATDPVPTELASYPRTLR